MKISRKKFIKTSVLSALGIGMVPNVFGLVPNRKSIPEKRKLGRTGIEVTTLGFGASRTQEPAVLKAAIDSGINFLDTGRRYANGENEVMIGKTLKGIREKYIIQSKMKIDWNGGSVSSDELRDQMETSLEESLKALQTDYIDVMLLHGISEEEILRSETIRTVFSEMKDRGAIRACGFSAHTNHVNMLKEANKDSFYDVAMVPFNPSGGFNHSQSDWSTSWDQEALVKEMKRAYQNGIGIVGMKTCSGGKYAFNEDDDPSFPKAVNWVRSHEFMATTAVAMANLSEIKSHS